MRGLPILLLASLLAGCAGEPTPAASAPAFRDVHALLVDPADARFVYVATHDGLFHGDGSSWARVGDAAHDFMGFAGSPDGSLFLASGHPPEGGNLGVLRSADRGATWTEVGPRGVDFHAIAVSPADPARAYGHTRGTVWRSDDGGTTWEPRSTLAAAAFAPHPTDPDLVLVATGSAIVASADAGETWRPHAQLRARGLVAAGNAHFAAGEDGVSRSLDGGRSWSAIGIPGATGAIQHVAARGDVLVASDGAPRVHRSDDAGRTWQALG